MKRSGDRLSGGRTTRAGALTRLAAVAVLWVASALPGCRPWGAFDNPVDPEAENYQGFPTVADPSEISPVAPADGAEFSFLPTFVSSAVENAAAYGLQISGDPQFQNIAFEIAEQESNTFDVSGADLSAGEWYWRCRSRAGTGEWGGWSAVWSFSIAERLVGLLDETYVTAGTFQMGSTTSSDEQPVHTVTLTRDFLIATYEVTQAQWREVMGTSPSSFSGDNRPVESVSWYEAVEFCNALSVLEGLEPAYSGSGDGVVVDLDATGYRLPTEAEWEYAARGGNASGGYTYSGSDTVGAVAWYLDNSGSQTHDVGTKAANELGIYDMSGNVWEWVWDWYDSGYYGASPGSDPAGPATGSYRVLRGGSWSSYATSCRVANRSYDTPSFRNYVIGFRPARTVR